jgi:aerobic carbon-monoxide dehydrogenase medium subunit
VSLNPQYARPRTAQQAVELLEGLGAGAMVIAGGQELMPHMNYGRLMPGVLVDIGGLAELRGIGEDSGRIAIGALTSHRELQTSALVRERVPLLAFAAQRVGGGWQVHNRGTVGGNIVAMHPLYDIAPALIALDTEVDVQTSSSTRRVALAALIGETAHGLGTTSLLTRIMVKPPASGAGWSYQKLKITNGSYGSANAAAVVGVAGGKLASIRLVIGAASERPVDASVALKGLLGRTSNERLLAETESVCAGLLKQPLHDQQGDSNWRRAMAGVVARRALAEAVSRASQH